MLHPAWAAGLGLLLCSFCLAADEPAAPPAPEPRGYWTGPINGPVPATIAGGKVAGLSEIDTLLAQGAVAIDVSNAPRRPEHLAASAPWLPLPHPVIPGSLWIPGVGLGFIPDELEQSFRERLARATGGDLDRPLLIYCHERCWLSWNAAKRAIESGYRNVHWYPEGIEGWRAAGRTVAFVKPQVTARTPIESTAWLAGCWWMERDNGFTEEQWLEPAGGATLGLSRTIIDGKLQEYEFVMIREVDGRLAYVAQPSAQAQAVFPLVSVSETELVFEDPEHDFPQRVIYRKVPEGVIARIEGMRNGQLRGVDYPYRACR